jgi:L-methionine (R)-S-oxide reductase
VEHKKAREILDKAEIYTEVKAQILAVLDGEENTAARMATVSCMLAHAFPKTYFWTGFYCVDPLKENELVVGPYQGTLGCLRIAFGRGVCGMAAETGETQLVEDVHALENHIACDNRSKSEIVVPVHGPGGKLIAVFDVDSTRLAAFDDLDKKWLEDIINSIFGG